MGSKIGDSKAFYIVISILISVALWLYVVTVETRTAKLPFGTSPSPYRGRMFWKAAA
jgi:hypothetical protein